jgi:hypothetical protein
VRLPPRLEQLSSHADGPLAERGRLGSSLGRAMTATLSVVDRVTIADVLRLGGFEQPDRHGFLICPLHAERSGSFHVLGDGTGYRCFGLLDLAVALGIAADRASAARWLEEAVR